MHGGMRRFLALAGVLLALTLPTHGENLSLISGGDIPSAVNGSGTSTVGLTAPSYTATTAFNTGAFIMNTGAWLCTDAGCSGHVGRNANSNFLEMVGYTQVQAPAYSAPGGTSLQLLGNATDGASAIGVQINNQNSLTTPGAKIASFYSDNMVTEQYAIDKDGAPVLPQRCNTTGTPGAATCNTAAGRSAIASTTNTVTITNSIVASTSIVNAMLQTNDTTCTTVHSIVPSAGSFVINVNGNCAANTNIGWWIVAK